MKDEIQEGIRIYYGGDMANDDGFGFVTARRTDKWGTDILIQMDDGRDLNVPITAFSDVYLGHGGTRFVTVAVYNVWRQKQLDRIKATVRNGKVVPKRT